MSAMSPAMPTRLYTTSPVLRSGLLTVFEHPRVHGHLPLTADLRVHLAHPTFPAAIVAARVAPHGVYVDHGESPVALLGHLDLPDLALVADELVRVEQLLPTPPPPLGVVPAPLEDPVHRVV